jgi:hypothetical protein
VSWQTAYEQYATEVALDASTEPPSRSTRLVRDDHSLPSDSEREVVTGIRSESVDQGVANVGDVLGRLAERDIEVARGASAVTEAYLQGEPALEDPPLATGRGEAREDPLEHDASSEPVEVGARRA